MAWRGVADSDDVLLIAGRRLKVIDDYRSTTPEPGTRELDTGSIAGAVSPRRCGRS
jgi:hypothetical protein